MIFLSASIPDPNRNPKYFETADLLAIRDAVRSLASIVIPNSFLIWGGHPAITSLIRYMMNTRGADLRDHTTLYQSELFEGQFPLENEKFGKIIITPKREDKEKSLVKMRARMFQDHQFKAGIFIGGMEGVEEEFELFRMFNPRALAIPVGSTGAAARCLYKTSSTELDKRLLNDFGYLSLFRDLLRDCI